nr:G protein-coupled receptor [Proales similis]
MCHTSRTFWPLVRIDCIKPKMFTNLVASLNAFNAVFGTIANLIVIASILNHAKLRISSPFILLLNLTLAQLFGLLFSSPFISLGIWKERDLLQRHPFLCSLQGSVLVIAGRSLMLTFVAIAINRFCLFFTPGLYKKIFSLRNTRLWSLLIWLVVFLLDLPNNIPFGKRAFDSRFLLCHGNPNSLTASLRLTVWFAYLPMLLTTAIHLFMVLNIDQVKSRITKMEQNSKALSHFKAIFLSWLLNCLCWLPQTSLIHLNLKPDEFVCLSLQTLSLSYFSLNPVLFAVYNWPLRNSIRRFLRCSFD